MVSEIIAEKYDSMSKTQKKIANYVLNNITDTSYLNIKELAEQVGAGEATIIRFCTFLGYKGYPEFKSALQDLAKARMDIKDRLRKSYDTYENEEAGIARVFHDDVGKIEMTLGNLDMKEFFSVCEKLILAHHIYIVASRSASALGQFFQYYLNIALGNVQLLTCMDCNTDVLSGLESNDVVIGITFSRYSKTTVDLFHYASEKKAQTIALTDSPVSPITKYATHTLIAETSMPSYFDSFVAPLTLINAILMEIGRNRNIELEHRITELDKFYDRFDLFE